MANADDEALAAFQHAAEELRFFKSQQWTVVGPIGQIAPT
jgi:hypothetical protein